MKMKLFVKFLLFSLFCLSTNAEPIESSDFNFLLKKIVYLEHEANILREHLALGGAFGGATKDAPSIHYRTEELDSIKERLFKIENEIRSGKFSSKQVLELEKKLADSKIAQLVIKIDSLKAEWQRDDEAAINEATDRAYEEMVSYYMFAIAVITLISTAIFFVLENRNKKLVDKKIASETAIQYEQIFDTWLEQKNNAREDTYRTSLLYSNLALNIYRTKFLVTQLPTEFGQHTNSAITTNESDRFEPLLLRKMRISPRCEIIAVQ
ncbi:hypothetical protein J3369_00290 [Alteromonas sp. NFXS44]|uniref:hypothetical protein n=1 Tax=Alteromonas sp. NFXS44 TaxID=2818435 RepID=UPI0032DE5934